MKKVLVKIVSIIFALLLVLVLVVKIKIRDRHPGYKIQLQINEKESGPIMAGFAAVDISPEIIDTWNDMDNNARYEPDKGDTYNDNNGNGEFDACWLAGFHNKRPANGIHDPLWARTTVFDNGKTRIAMVSLDAIGLFHDQVIEIRKRITAQLNVDYCMVASTHVHEAPDLMGIWGESPFKSGVDENYMEYVIAQSVKSVSKAIDEMEPVTLYFGQDLESALPLVKDTRPPIVHDPGMYIIHAKKKDGTSKGNLVLWANHPETLWSKNLLITSDFPHYFRKELENRLGGHCVYFNGAIGGLITTHPSLAIRHPETGKELLEATFEKAEAQGIILADIAEKIIKNPQDSISSAAIGLQAKTFTIPFKNKLFRLAAALGLIDRGMTGFWKVRTEIAAFTIGPATFLTIPGEIYPEIVNGGIEAPTGQDYTTSPVESPSLRELMPGKYKFVIGLANDELGYIIPKSEWDNEAPWIYGDKELYGEENSLGPETAPIIHKISNELLQNLKQN